MPTTFCRGGMDRINDNASWWLDSGVNMYGSLVAGTSISTDRNDQTMQDFLLRNALVNDDAGNQDVLMSTNRRGQLYQTLNQRNRFELNWDGELALGLVNLSTQVAGVVLYGESTVASNPANAIILCHHDKPVLGKGNTMRWGGNGTNLLGYLKQVDAGTTCFRGAIEQLVAVADIWGASSWDLGFALVEEGNSFDPKGTERTMADITALYCTNGDPVSSIASGAVVLQTGLQRRVLWETQQNDSIELMREQESAGGSQVLWPFTGGGGGNLTNGEVVVAVVQFLFPTGNYSDATAYPFNWDANPNYTITTGENIIYGGTADNRILSTYVNLAA